MPPSADDRVDTGARRAFAVRMSHTRLRSRIAATVVVAAAALAVACTLGYVLRGSGYDECAPNQPWWNSWFVLFVPALAVLAQIVVFTGKSSARASRTARGATAAAGAGLLVWFGWYCLVLFGLGFTCGWP
jgi:hypothetical protein